MADLNQLITLGIGTPGDIEHFILIGLSGAAVVEAPVQIIGPWEPLPLQPPVRAYPRPLVVRAILEATPTIERVPLPIEAVGAIILHGDPMRMMCVITEALPVFWVSAEGDAERLRALRIELEDEMLLLSGVL